MSLPNDDEQGLTWDEWCLHLDRYHEKLRMTVPGFEGYGPGSVVNNCGDESWRGYFNDGYSPEDALDEDMTYWDG